ncbi:MAG: hypothetical protein U9N56_09450 [Actinomycetota bacterium]|nr:hypothetical protein [Actinomycetota bacterium]
MLINPKISLLAGVVLAVAACSGGPAVTASSEADSVGTSTTVSDTEPAPATTEPLSTTTEPPVETTTSEAQENTDGTSTSLAEPLAVGRVVLVGGWRVRVASIAPDSVEAVMAENDFNDPPGEGEQFFMARLEATYVGEESSTFWFDMTLKAVGGSNVAYEAFEADCGVIPDDINDAGETFTGGTVTGNVCWRIKSDDADSLVMIAEEFFSFEETRAFLSLDASATPVEESTSGGATADSPDGVSVGQHATVGSWDLVVLSVTPDATADVMAENDFNDPPGEREQFFMVSLEATYVGEESSTFWIDMTLKALGDSNVAYEPFESGCGVIPDDINDAGETFPEGTITGNVCWRINFDDVDSLVMIAEEGFSFEETRTFFALGE